MTCLARERKTDWGQALPLQFLRQRGLPKLKFCLVLPRSDRLCAEAFVEIVVQVVEIQHSTVEDQRQLRYVRSVDDQIQIS